MKQVVCALLVLGAVAGSTSAHVVYDRRTLRQWAEQAQLIVVAEVLSPLRVWTASDGSDHQEYFSVRVIETLAGASPGTELDVFAHAEGEPRLRVGDTMLLFLDPAAERAEFASLSTRFPYFTTQGAGQEWTFPPGDPTIPSLATAWRSLRLRGGTYSDRRDLLLRQLESHDSRLRGDALAELVRMRASTEFRTDRQGVERLIGMARSPDRSIRERVALIKLLDGVEGFSSASALLSLDRPDLATRDRVTIIRACGYVTGPGATAWLREQLRSPDTDVPLAVLSTIGNGAHPELADAVASLTKSPDTRLARAATRTLAAIRARAGSPPRRTPDTYPPELER